MRLFKYRTPRFPASAQLSFSADGKTASGVSTNVSLGGVRAMFEDGAPAVGSAGSLMLRYPQRQFSFGAVVTHLEGKEVGFSFVLENKEERKAAEQFALFLKKDA